ncbi:hypothetical protein LCGC14_2276750, partial [marine sediment metagenome]
YISGEVIVPGTQVPGRLYLHLQPYDGNGTQNNATGGYDLTTGQYARFTFYLPDYIDPDKDIKITFILRSDGSDATEEMKIYVSAYQADNSEDPATWNVENGTEFTFDSTNADYSSKYIYTLSSGDISKGDSIGFLITSNVGAGGVVISVGNASVEMHALTAEA